MGCLYSRLTRDEENKHAWECRLTGTSCKLGCPDSIACANKFAMGPDSYHDKEQTVVNKVIEDIISDNF